MTTKSPFETVAARLYEQGLSIIPIMPREKRPGAYANGRWAGMMDWSQYSRRLPREAEIEEWSTWPLAGVGLCTGEVSGLIALDIDTDAPREQRAIIDALGGPSPFVKRGGRGETHFYAYPSEAVESRQWQRDGVVMCEVLAGGRQTILPPSIHPAGRPYIWLAGELDVTDLPPCPPDVATRLDRLFPPPKGKKGVAVVGNGYFDDIKARALADLDAWVPRLLPEAKACRTGYRMRATWRGGDGPNVSITSRGIVDHAHDGGLTAIDLVAKAVGVSGGHAAQLLAKLLPEEDVSMIQVSPPAPVPAVPLDLSAPPDIFETTGTLRLMVDRILATSVFPQPILALAASICAVGALAGRRYATPTGLRTNIYAIGVGESGCGKDHARKEVGKWFHAAGLARFVGADRLASEAGLLREVRAFRPRLYLLDEFGMILEQVLSNKASTHLRDLYRAFTQLYTTADGVYRGTAYAQSDAEEIPSPHICLYGTTVPATLWSALSHMSMEDGGMARYLIFEVPRAGARPQRLNVSLSAPPPELLEAMRAIASHAPVSIETTSCADIYEGEPYVIPMEDEAVEVMGALERELAEEAHALAMRRLLPIINRVWEHAAKLAAIYAVSECPGAPVMSARACRWGVAVARYSANLMMEAARNNVADNEHEARHNRLLSIIRDAGAGGILHRDLVRASRWLKDGERKELLGTMMEAETVGTIPEGRSRRYVAV
jgi:hypothetical protein